MQIDHPKFFRLEMDLEQLHAGRYGMAQRQRDISADIRDVLNRLTPSKLWKPEDGTAVLLGPMNPDKAMHLREEIRAAQRIEALKAERASLAARLTVANDEVHALTQLVTACREFIDAHAAAEAAAALAAELAATETTATTTEAPQ